MYEKILIECFMNIEHPCALGSLRVTVQSYCQSAMSAEKNPGTKTTQVEAHLATHVWFYCKLSQLRTLLDKLHSRLLTNGQTVCG